MIYDLNENSEPGYQTTDIVIMGGGIAGIYLALKLGRAGKKIALLEGGGIDYSDDSQDKYSGDSIGDYHLANGLKNSRMRFLGGSSNCWAGGCTRLDKQDFIKKEWIPSSGWPITLEDLDRHYARVENFLQVDSGSSSPDYEFQPQGFEIKELKYTEMGPFGFEFEDELRASENIFVYLNANVAKLNIDKLAIKSIEAINSSGQIQYFFAENFIISCGGIASTNLLQNNPDILDKAASKHLGKYFSDHPIAPCATLLLNEGVNIKTAQHYWDQRKAPYYVLPWEDQKSHKLANCAMQFYDEPNPLSKSTISALKIKSWLTGETNMPKSKDFSNSIIGFKDVLRDRKNRNTGSKSRISVRFQVENVPNPLSTVEVIQDKSLNPLGRPVLNWNIGEIETKTIYYNLAALSAALQSMGLGILKLDWQLFLEQTQLPKDLRGGQHHCGTLRMASDPSLGVVDENLKAFGTSNLYVCSSAVFPTNSWANPTLTILALADRLKSHLLA